MQKTTFFAILKDTFTVTQIACAVIYVVIPFVNAQFPVHQNLSHSAYDIIIMCACHYF